MGRGGEELGDAESVIIVAMRCDDGVGRLAFPNGVERLVVVGRNVAVLKVLS